MSNKVILVMMSKLQVTIHHVCDNVYIVKTWIRVDEIPGLQKLQGLTTAQTPMNVSQQILQISANYTYTLSGVTIWG